MFEVLRNSFFLSPHCLVHFGNVVRSQRSRSFFNSSIFFWSNIVLFCPQRFIVCALGYYEHRPKKIFSYRSKTHQLICHVETSLYSLDCRRAFLILNFFSTAHCYFVKATLQNRSVNHCLPREATGQAFNSGILASLRTRRIPTRTRASEWCLLLRI